MDLEIEYPRGTRHKDRDAIEGRLSDLRTKVDADAFAEIVSIIEYALASGARKVPARLMGWD